jgi:hypothetical protein
VKRLDTSSRSVNEDGSAVLQERKWTMANATSWEAGAEFRATRGFGELARALVISFTILLTMPIAGVAGGGEDSDAPEAQALLGKRAPALPFKDVKILIEHNATAQDTGFQVFLDGDPWNRLEIEGPDGDLLEVKARGNLKSLGLTEFFFETNEPENAEVPIEQLLAQFPAGDYEFTGRSIDGARMTGRAALTHTIPMGPEILSPTEGEVVDPNDTVIRWNLVTESITGSPVDIVGYEVIITKPVDVPPPGFSKPVLSVHVSASTTSLTVPWEFFEPATDYEFEVLALEAGGNQTISSGTFSTE